MTPDTDANRDKNPLGAAKIKVLVVDDERDIRDLLVDELIDLEYEVIEAENGAEALDRVYINHPDIVLLDLMMPVLDGIQFLKVLRSNPRTSQIPAVVLLTAVSATEGEQRAIDLGANHYVTKPWMPGAIQSVIQATLIEAGIGEQTNPGVKNSVEGTLNQS